MLAQTMVPLLALLTAASPPPVAQDGSWLAWHGCWRNVANDAPPGEVLCILPGSDAAEMRMLTVVDGRVAETTTVRADGVARPVDDGGCRGTETARWSEDGRRVFLTAELDCEGIRRESSGAIAMVAENEWLHAQAATVAGQHAARSIRYRAIAGTNMPAEVRAAIDDARTLAREAARLHVSAPMNIEDVIEATSFVAAPALEALLAARGAGFDMDARKVVRLEEAGVPGSVIDMTVALSYPTRFVVSESSVAAPAAEPTYRPGTAGWADSCYDPFLDMYRYGRACDDIRFGYRSRYGYSRYGYSPWGYDPYGWRYPSGPGVPVVVIIQPREDDEPSRGPSQLVKGAGYTRGTTATGSAGPRTGATSAGAGSTTRPSTTTGSGSSTTSSPPATSSGSTGRTAVPRTGGGGGGGGGQ
jgi:hypothetical protein